MGHLPYGGRPKEGTFYFAGFGYETYDGKYDADRRNHIVGAPKKNEKTKKFRELFVSIDFRRLKTPEIQRRRVAVHVCEPYNASRLPAGRAAFFLIRLTIRPYRIFAAILCHPTEPLRFKPPHSAALRLQQSCCGRFCVSWRISLPKSTGQSF